MCFAFNYLNILSKIDFVSKWSAEDFSHLFVYEFVLCVCSHMLNESLSFKHFNGKGQLLKYFFLSFWDFLVL